MNFKILSLVVALAIVSANAAPSSACADPSSCIATAGVPVSTPYSRDAQVPFTASQAATAAAQTKPKESITSMKTRKGAKFHKKKTAAKASVKSSATAAQTKQSKRMIGQMGSQVQNLFGNVDVSSLGKNSEELLDMIRQLRKSSSGQRHGYTTSQYGHPGMDQSSSFDDAHPVHPSMQNDNESELDQSRIFKRQIDLSRLQDLLSNADVGSLNSLGKDMLDLLKSHSSSNSNSWQDYGHPDHPTINKRQVNMPSVTGVKDTLRGLLGSKQISTISQQRLLHAINILRNGGNADCTQSGPQSYSHPSEPTEEHPLHPSFDSSEQNQQGWLFKRMVESASGKADLLAIRALADEVMGLMTTPSSVPHRKRQANVEQVRQVIKSLLPNEQIKKLNTSTARRIVNALNGQSNDGDCVPQQQGEYQHPSFSHPETEHPSQPEEQGFSGSLLDRRQLADINGHSSKDGLANFDLISLRSTKEE